MPIQTDASKLHADHHTNSFILFYSLLVCTTQAVWRASENPYLRWIDERLALSVWCAVHLTRTQIPSLDSAWSSGHDSRHTDIRPRAHNSSALKRVCLIKPGISVWAQEGRRVENGNTFYLCFSETNISEAKLDFCNLQDTFKRGNDSKGPV